MKSSITHLQDASVVTISESIDCADSDTLETLLNNLIDSGKTRLVIDLTDMDFICSTGLGVLVKTFTCLRQCGGFLRLARPRPPIVKLIKTTGLHRLFAIYDSVERAVR